MSTTEAVEPVDVDQLSASQRERRGRMLEAARALATKGGYDGVQMREVADEADVALGTLYRYFPSKIHLLVAVLEHETGSHMGRLRITPPTGGTAAERVLTVLARTVTALQRHPKLTEATVRALMVAGTDAATQVDNVAGTTTDAITAVMVGDDRKRTDDDEAIARVLQQVLMSSLLAWLSGRSSSAQMTDDLDVAVRLLLR